jgi:hypothetical protein
MFHGRKFEVSPTGAAGGDAVKLCGKKLRKRKRGQATFHPSAGAK